MYRNFLLIFSFLVFVVLLTGCGDVEPITKPPPPEVAEISSVLKERWKEGYETEDLELFMSAFWREGYYYWSDMATDSDVGDDLIFDDLDIERDAAIMVFKEYRNIEIEISQPPEVKILNDEKTKAEVRNHYKIQLYVPQGTSLPGGYEALYAEGDNVFIFEFKNNGNVEQEWRIVQWLQYEYSEEEIEAAWSLQ